jgi:hypothetical protein
MFDEIGCVDIGCIHVDALGKVTLNPRCQACVFIYSSCGRWVFPPLLWSFPPSTTLTRFPAPGCWARALLPLPPEPLQPAPACLFTVPGRIPFPQSSVLRAPHPLSCVSYLFLLLITQFLFFSPGWRSVCPGGYAALAQACLWGYRGTAKLTWSKSSQAVWAPVTGGLGALLGSPFNVKWRCSELAGGVEGSKLCLFSVIMPAKCVSSFSPRFHYRRLAFCFLPLSTILESPPTFS